MQQAGTRQTKYFVQTFTRPKFGGGLHVWPALSAPNREAAIERARDLVGIMTGVIALALTPDPDHTDGFEPQILFSAGEIPE
jgi:hypothetical protein